MLATLAACSRWIWAVGPFCAALAGVGFKNFSASRRGRSGRGDAAAAGELLAGSTVSIPARLHLLTVSGGLPCAALPAQSVPIACRTPMWRKSVFAYWRTNDKPTNA